MRFSACLIAAFACYITVMMTARSETSPEPPTSENAARVQEPPPSPEEFAKGAELFAQICSHCHGPHMVNPGNSSFDLRKFPHDDRQRFFNSVRNGKRTMPPWKDVLHPDEIEAVWAYVRTGGVAPK